MPLSARRHWRALNGKHGNVSSENPAMSSPRIYINGKLFDKADAKISVYDHGLLYGDGVFEGIRLYGGNVYRLDEHLERLEHSARAIMLQIPLSRAELAAATCETCRLNNLTDAYIRLVVTRGVGDLGLSPWLCPKPSVFIIADKISLYPQEHYDKGLAIVTVPTRRINPAALPPTIKSLNYLNNILGKIEARELTEQFLRGSARSQVRREVPTQRINITEQPANRMLRRRPRFESWKV